MRIGASGDDYIVVWGGVSFWRSLMRLDLIDEFRLDLYPYVAGEGTRLFDDVPKSHRLDRFPAPRSATGSSGCGTAGTANPAADMHDEWQSGERRYGSEGVHGPTQTNQRCWRHRRDRQRRVDTEDQPQSPPLRGGVGQAEPRRD
jgi:hypothetical protein